MENFLRCKPRAIVDTWELAHGMRAPPKGLPGPLFAVLVINPCQATPVGGMLTAFREP